MKLLWGGHLARPDYATLMPISLPFPSPNI